ncbi:hypothetical protein N1851_009454 [Merluccius polli]|uniref:Uncharacterized protein n=1 Tax=Merluccius polli TaxID=89951 RepID=A0AA47N160_MERPO|nr:hypothetical protein N1851_009454 [Merluccius polli]
MEEQMLRDQLMERVANTRIRDRLLLESDLNLAKATTLALQIETGIRNADVLSDNTAAATPVRAGRGKRRSWPRGPHQLQLQTPVNVAPATAVDLPATWLISRHALRPELHAIPVVKWDIFPKFVGLAKKRCVRY